jgi:hypothetical protein
MSKEAAKFPLGTNLLGNIVTLSSFSPRFCLSETSSLHSLPVPSWHKKTVKRADHESACRSFAAWVARDVLAVRLRGTDCSG